MLRDLLPELTGPYAALVLAIVAAVWLAREYQREKKSKDEAWEIVRELGATVREQTRAFDAWRKGRSHRDG